MDYKKYFFEKGTECDMKDLELKYLKSLANQFPTIAAASTEILNLQSILNLPKGTDYFLTDLHGEYTQFNHLLKNKKYGAS